MAETGLPASGNGVSFSPRREVSLLLLGGFRLEIGGGAVAVAPGGQRLLAFLALRERGAGRRLVAATLWPDTPECKANANLRSALWRLQRLGGELTDVDGERLRLAPSLRVDVQESVSRAHELLDGAPLRPGAAPSPDIALFSKDVLPDWWEDWIVLEREGFRQLRMHALERLCEQLTAAGRFPDALRAGLAVVAAEPLRESAHRRLIGVHLAQGNTGEARRRYESYRRLLHAELGCEPSREFARLVAGRGSGSPSPVVTGASG